MISQSLRAILLSAAIFLSTTLLVSSFSISSPSVKFFRIIKNNCHERQNACKSNFEKSTRLSGAQITTFDFEDEDDSDPSDTRTDEEKGLTHGYEGDFKVGDVVKVRLYSLRPIAEDGSFRRVDFIERPVSLKLSALLSDEIINSHYIGRSMNSDKAFLSCSAISKRHTLSTGHSNDYLNIP
jgi:hypothetical protein